MEELQEADVLWPEEDMRRSLAYSALLRGNGSPGLNNGAIGSAKETAPITIPSPASACHHHRSSWKLECVQRDEDGNDDSNDKEMVPPHILVARRLSEKMAFSVCTGQGRTLKGRDLSQVRNSVLRLTGFLEG